MDEQLKELKKWMYSKRVGWIFSKFGCILGTFIRVWRTYRISFRML
jgi:hypothetical protein